MPKAIRYDQPGGPDVMKWVDVEVGAPQAGEVRIKQHAVGLNYIDVYFRTGLYPQPLPGGLGMEAAGEVTAVGEGVSALKVGDRVAYVAQPPGAYAQERVLSAERVVKLPDGIGYDDAASVMLQGLTAHYLLRRTYPVKAGDTILIHAAAGGVPVGEGARRDRDRHGRLRREGRAREGAWLRSSDRLYAREFHAAREGDHERRGRARRLRFDRQGHVYRARAA